jgi:hypothetical protein
MRKIIASLFQSLDGVIQAPGGPEEDQAGFPHGGWVFPYFDDSLDGPAATSYCSAGEPMRSSPHTGRTTTTSRSAKPSMPCASMS